MSKEQGAGGTGGDAGGETTDDLNDQGGGATDGDKSVKHSTYKKTVDEVKRLKAELKSRDERLSKAEQDQLSAEGKKDELIAKLKSDNDKLGKSNKDILNSFVSSSLDSQVREEAARLGCVDADAVTKLIDLSDVEVDPKTFRADKAKLTEVLEDLKKSKPYLFNKAGPKINGKLPDGKGPKVPKVEGKKLAELSTEQLWQKLREAKN